MDMTADDLLSKIHHRPFRSFRIRMTNTTSIGVTEPRMIIVSSSSAVVPTDFAKSKYRETIAGRWKTISLDHIVEFCDLDSERNSSR